MSTYVYTPPKRKSFFASPVLSNNLDYDKRTHQRRRCTLCVSIKAISNKFEFEAKSVDISRGGMGIETDKRLNVGDKLEIWIHLSGELGPVHRFGRIMWLRKKDSVFYNGGIKFESPMNCNYH